MLKRIQVKKFAALSPRVVRWVDIDGVNGLSKSLLQSIECLIILAFDQPAIQFVVKVFEKREYAQFQRLEMLRVDGQKLASIREFAILSAPFEDDLDIKSLSDDAKFAPFGHLGLKARMLEQIGNEVDSTRLRHQTTKGDDIIR